MAVTHTVLGRGRGPPSHGGPLFDSRYVLVDCLRASRSGRHQEWRLTTQRVHRDREEEFGGFRVSPIHAARFSNHIPDVHHRLQFHPGQSTPLCHASRPGSIRDNGSAQRTTKRLPVNGARQERSYCRRRERVSLDPLAESGHAVQSNLARRIGRPRMHARQHDSRGVTHRLSGAYAGISWFGDTQLTIP